MGAKEQKRDRGTAELCSISISLFSPTRLEKEERLFLFRERLPSVEEYI
jgi:hypothetical protein